MNDNFHVETDKSMGPEDWDRWEREMEELAAKILPEDFIRMDEALAEADREAKLIVHRQMGPAGSSESDVHEESPLEIPEWQRKVLDERLTDLEQHPEDEQTWEEVKVDLWSEP